MTKTRKNRVFSGILTFTSLLIIFTFFSSYRSSLETEHTHRGRQLLHAGLTDVDLNCTPRSIGQFPGDFMTEEQRKKGGVAVHILICLYIFAAIAIVCDDYFVASLEKLSTVLNMQSDVAGATFMAAGSSAPELFTSIVGVFFAKSDVGLGTIVGSAVFNILVIIAVVALFAGQVIHLLWWPMTRDCFVYVLSVVTLTLVIMDNLVTWYESVAMLILYILYIIFMFFNQRIGNYAIHRVDQLNLPCCVSPRPESSERERLYSETSPLLENSVTESKNQTEKTNIEENVEGVVVSNSSTFQEPTEDLTKSGLFQRSHTSSISVHSKHDNTHSENSQFESPLEVPQSWPKRIGWAIMLPASVLLVITIPDHRRGGVWTKFFPLTFIMSIAWLGGLSYVMVWMVTIIGDTLGIPDAIMGLTLLAAGTSIPDALASLFVAKDGYGDMAISNSIGSNIFDILICLGLPWFLQTVFIATGDMVPINSNGIVYTAAILLGTVFLLLITMMIYKWKLDKKIGAMLLIVYAIVITIACLFETNVFGNFNLPMCSE